jgi:hypothetical protein
MEKEEGNKKRVSSEVEYVCVQVSVCVCMQTCICKLLCIIYISFTGSQTKNKGKLPGSLAKERKQ